LNRLAGKPIQVQPRTRSRRRLRNRPGPPTSEEEEPDTEHEPREEKGQVERVFDWNLFNISVCFRSCLGRTEFSTGTKTLAHML
jgi:hypothetical protein